MHNVHAKTKKLLESFLSHAILKLYQDFYCYTIFEIIFHYKIQLTLLCFAMQNTSTIVRETRKYSEIDKS